MNRTIFLIGPMASGKSAVGTELARLLGSRVLDTDSLVVQQHGPIKEIFAELGEAAFRGFETQALREAAHAVPGPAMSPVADDAGRRAPVVVATGGGTVLAPENRKVISGGFAVYLFTDAATVARRIAGDTGRPLLSGAPDSNHTDADTPESHTPLAPAAPTALETWKRIFADRSALYEQCADVRIDTRTQDPARIAEAIVTAYRDAGH